MATTSRFFSATVPNQDNTGRVATYDTQTPAYAATLNITTSAYDTLVVPGTLTGAMTVNVGVGSSTTAPYVGDTLQLLFKNTSGSTQTVTLGTGVSVSATTLAIPTTKKGAIYLVFDGATWVETGRAVTV